MVSKDTGEKRSKTEGERHIESERIMITVPELLVKKLNDEKEERGYGSVQVIINEAIRGRYFGVKKVVSSLSSSKGSSGGIYGGARRGRKPKFDHEKMVSGENVLVWGDEAKAKAKGNENKKGGD